METINLDRKLKLLLYVILLSLIVIPQIEGKGLPQVTSATGSIGLQIEVVTRTLKVKEYYQFASHVYNISNGKQILSGISCDFHLYNSSGKHILRLLQNSSDSFGDYEFEINSKNLTTTGIYAFIISCNNSAVGGFFMSPFYVTKSGISSDDVGESEGTFNQTLFFGLLLMFIITLAGSVFIPFKDKYNEEFKIVSVNDLKYVKVLSMVFCYISFMFILGFLSSVANTYILLGDYSYLFRYSYLIMLSILFPLIVVSILFLGIMFIESLTNKKKIKRRT